MNGIDYGIDVALLTIGVIAIALPILKNTIDSLTNLSTIETIVLGVTSVVLVAIFIRKLAKSD